jgi:methionine-rich copper-binding protein CopC
MEIALERYLDDTSQYHLTLALRSRTAEAHSVLTALEPQERAAVTAALAHALDEVQRIVAARLTSVTP